MQKLTIAKTMHGCFLAPKQHISPKRDEGDSSETEEETDEDDSDYNFELGDQHLSSRGSDKMSVNSRRLKKTTVSFRDYEDGKVHRVEGIFPLSDPWWSATLFLSGGHKLGLVGCRSLKLRSDELVTRENIVWLFVTACMRNRKKECVYRTETDAFYEALRSWEMDDKLTFDNLHELLDKFASVNDTNKKYAGAIRSRIDHEFPGRLVWQSRTRQTLFAWLPCLLPKHFSSLVLDVNENVQDRLEEALDRRPWVFGFADVMSELFNITGCEAALESFYRSRLSEHCSPTEIQAMYLYFALKRLTRQQGHTYVIRSRLEQEAQVVRGNYQRPSKARDQSGLSTVDWGPALDFLDTWHVIVRENNGTHVFLSRYWTAEKEIANAFRYLRKNHEVRPWTFEIDPENELFERVRWDADQLRAAELIASQPVIVLSGKGGCGKTEVVSAVVSYAVAKINSEKMAESSDVKDDALTQIAVETELAFIESQKQSTVVKESTDRPLPVDLLVQCVPESPSEAVLCDVNEDIIGIYRDKAACGDNRCISESPSETADCNVSVDVVHTFFDEISCGNECFGLKSSHTESSQNKASSCDDLVCCNGDTSDSHAAQILTSDTNPEISNCYFEENLHSSNSRCMPNTHEGIEPAMDCDVSNQPGKSTSAQIENSERKSDDEEGVGELSEEKFMSTCLVDSVEPLAVDGGNSDDKASGGLPDKNLVEKCPTMQPSDKPPPHLSFSSDVLLVAPTGKAANVLGRRTGIQAFTLHQVIYSHRAWRQSESRADADWKFNMVRVLVVDEGSLVAVTTFHSLISKVLLSLQKVVLLGDVLQLPSIEPGRFLVDVYEAMNTIGCSITLSTNHRAESQCIVDNACRISEQKFPVCDSSRNFHMIRLPASLKESSLSNARDCAIRKLLEGENPDCTFPDHYSSQFIAFRRCDCAAINEICSMHYANHPTRTNKKKLKFQIGDKVCCTKNAYVNDLNNPNVVAPLRLCNGEIFFITDILIEQEVDGRQSTRVTLTDLERTIIVDMKELKNRCKLRHAWARTIHTFQGSEAGTVVYVVGSGRCQTWQHVYTAVTRGRNQVIIVTRKSMLDWAIENQPITRCTSLYDKLTASLDLTVDSSSSDEDIEDEEEMQKTVDDTKSVVESDVTTVSEFSVSEEMLEMCRKYDFDSDASTISDVGEMDDPNFSQWTDSMDALVASFDVAENSTAAVTAGADVSQKSRENFETVSTLNSPVMTPSRSRAGISVGNTASPSAAKRHLESTFDTLQGPPSSRQRQTVDEGVTDAQSAVSPLRKTLASTLLLRTS